MSAEIQVENARGSRWRWQLVNDDGRPIAASVDTFPTEDKAKRAAKTAATAMHGARVVTLS